MIFPFFLRSNKKRWQEDWVEICRTDDDWEAELIKTLLSKQEITCRPDHKSQIRIYVEPHNEELAREIISQVDIAITEHKTSEMSAPLPIENDFTLNDLPVNSNYINLAEDPEVGKVVHYYDQGIELQIGPEPYQVLSEESWEEFTDFSAQRQEFVILLHHDYPVLLKWLKARKLLHQFVRLIQSTYQN